jgi:hypothetical protein
MLDFFHQGQNTWASLAGLYWKELATLGCIPSVDSITTEAGIPAVDYIPAASVFNAIFS